MPCFRGIELSIVAASDNTPFPEFPHPDGSSARFGGLKASRHSSAVFLSPQPRRQADDYLSDNAQRHADPKISVYIPSAPETNFYFRYGISQAPVGHKYLFFRITINGRQVVSWGVDLSETTAGAAHQALFEPSTYYQHNDNGVVMTEYGIESRCFRFVSYGSREASIADDGGLIEVQVFRAKARNRRSPQPDQYRGGDKYGIANGLLENPHLASYYDYHLVDAKDDPYASFRFHYRSWENLRLLQLTPAEKPDFLCASPSKSLHSQVAAHGSTDTRDSAHRSPESGSTPCIYEEPKFDDYRRDNTRKSWLTENMGFDFATTSSRDQTREPTAAWLQHDSESGVVSANLPAALATLESDSLVGARLASIHKGRPLPQLPISHKSTADPVDNKGGQGTPEVEKRDGGVFNEGEEFHIQRTRGLSAVSKGSAASKVSIAKSLQAYADGEDGLFVDTMEFGSATKLETVFHGKASGKPSPKSNQNKCSVAPSDSISPGARSCTSVEVCGPTSEYLTPSPTKKKSKSKILFVAPFTDSLRKREVAPVPLSGTYAATLPRRFS